MILAHRCRTCGHRTNWHTIDLPTLCSNGCCACVVLVVDPEPQLLPTYFNCTPIPADGINPTIIPPGESMNAHCPKFSHRVVACDCPRCKERYEELTT